MVTGMREADRAIVSTPQRERWQAPANPLTLAAVEAEVWADLIAAELGLFFPVGRRRSLEERLWSRMQSLGLSKPASYRAYLDSHPDEWGALADALVVTESRFFREEASFRALRESILPECIAHRETGGGRRELSLWSAGCSTGEEAYTLAMIALETVPLPTIWDLHILGSDLSARNIDHAREGNYDLRRLESLPADWRTRYAEENAPARQVRMGAAVRLLTTFRQHNLCGESWPIGSQDVIVCQNVIFYFRREDQLRVLNRLYDTLRPGGALLIGATELPLVPIRTGVTPSRVGDALAYRRPWSRW
jgi:chemotaxis methyl-accepting protein methylase